MEASGATDRRYGNFRKPQSAGLGGLGTIGTVGLFGGLVLVIVTMMVAGILPALAVLAVAGTLLGTLSVRGAHGRTAAQGIAARAGWARTRTTGAHVYRSGPVSRIPAGCFRLPGIAAELEAREYEDAYARLFALVRVPSRGHYTVVFSAEPDGASLVDQQQVDSWVAHWGGFLAGLADEPGIVGASVTVEAAPDSGTRLRREVEANMHDDAPAVARAMLREVADTYPAGSATVRAYVALTFSGAGRGFARKRDHAAMARDLQMRVHALGNQLQATGAGTVRPMSATALGEVVRCAYDPAAAVALDAARMAGEAPGVEWNDIGPAAAQAGWGHYRHDGAVSITWSMTGAPRGEIHARQLERLLRPHVDVDRKRVTLLYRPIDRGTAAQIVEADKRNADFRVNAAKRPTSRALVDQKSAHAVAGEEAKGAGLVNFAMLVTASVTDPERLDHARQAVAHLAPTARVVLRPVFGSQDSAFAAALPLGIVLPAHLKVPAELRERL